MNGVSSALVIVSMVLFLGCEDKQTEAEKEYLQRQIEEEKKAKEDAQKKLQIAEKETNETIKIAKDAIAYTQQDMEDQKIEQEALRRTAEEKPVSISSINISNITPNGTELESKSKTASAFNKYDVKYIRWSVDYTNNVAIAKMKANGKLYVQFIDKNGFILNGQGYFYNNNGDYVDYTEVKEILDNDTENGTWSGNLGSESGGDFETGMWKVRFYWDNNNKGKTTTYLGEGSFEVL